MQKLSFIVPIVFLVGLESGCRRRPQVVVYTSVDQVYSEPVFKYCASREKLDVRPVFDTEETKSTGITNRLIAEAAHPQADVFWSNDPVRPFLLLRRGLVAAYRSPAAERIPARFRAQDGAWTGLAARARVLLVNTKRLAGRALPTSIRDLADPKWKGQATMANPLFGTTTVHVAALFVALGDQAAKDLLNRIKANGVRLASSNGEVRRLVENGEVVFGLTDTDDAFEARKSGAPVRIVFPDQQGMGTLFMPTVVVAIKGGPHPKAARRLIDCLLSREVERQMAVRAAHIPLGSGVSAQGIRSAGEIKTMKVDYRAIAAKMEEIQPWLRKWAGM